MCQRATERGQRGGDGVSHAEVRRDRRGPSTGREHRVGDRQDRPIRNASATPTPARATINAAGHRRDGSQRAEDDRAGQPDEVHASHAVQVAQRAGAEHCGRHRQSGQAGDECGGASRDLQAARDDLEVGREDRRVADGNGVAEAHGDDRHRGRQARDIFLLAIGTSIRRHALDATGRDRRGSCECCVVLPQPPDGSTGCFDLEGQALCLTRVGCIGNDGGAGDRGGAAAVDADFEDASVREYLKNEVSRCEHPRIIR